MLNKHSYINQSPNQPGNMPLVKINAVSAVVTGSIGFRGIGDLTSANGTMVSTTIRKIPDKYLSPYIDSIYDRVGKLFVC